MRVNGVDINNTQADGYVKFAHAVAFSTRRNWCRVLSEEEAVSAAFWGICTAIMAKGEIDFAATYLWARGAIIKELYWMLHGRKKATNRPHICIDDCLSDLVVSPRQLSEVEASSELEHVFRCLSEMPEMKATVLVESAIEQRPSSEIAARHGWTPGTVSSALGSARRLLRARVSGTTIKMRRVGGKRVAFIEHIAQRREGESDD